MDAHKPVLGIMATAYDASYLNEVRLLMWLLIVCRSKRHTINNRYLAALGISIVILNKLNGATLIQLAIALAQAKNTLVYPNKNCCN